MDPSELSLHNPSHQYVYRVPSPPRIFVPPPIQTSIDSPINTSTGRTSFLQPSILFKDCSFLSSIHFKHPQPRDHVIDWTYGERQAAQQILPFLFLGPLAAARDKAFLQSNQITMVLGVRKVMDGFMLNPRAPRDLQLEMQFVDTTRQGELIESFGRLIALVNGHLERRYHAAQADPSISPGRVLVFCESGNERSATAVAAYIMAVYGVGLVEAVQIVQGQRFCINIDDDARTRLETFGHMLRARMDVLEAQHHRQDHSDEHLRVVPARLQRKRTAERMMQDDEDDDSAADMTMGQDLKRDGSAPFSDSVAED